MRKIYAAIFIGWILFPSLVNGADATKAVTPGHSSTSYNLDHNGQYTVTVTAGEGWEFDGPSDITKGELSWNMVGAHSAKSTASFQLGGAALEVVELHGYLKKAGAGGDTRPEYWAEFTGKTFYIKCTAPQDQAGSQEKVTILWKSNATFTSYENGSPVSSSWTVDGGNMGTSESITVGADMEPGQYDVTASKDGSSDSMTLVILKSIDVWDSDNRHAADKILEVVPNKLGEDINGKLEAEEEIEDWPEWTYNSDTKYGKLVKFPKGANGWKSGLQILNNVKPRIEPITCEGVPIDIKRYPYDISLVYYDTAGPTLLLNKILDAITVFVPSDVEIKVSRIEFDFINQWKEQKDTNLCGWTYNADIDLKPLYSLKAALTLKPKALKKLEKKIIGSKWYKKTISKYVLKHKLEADIISVEMAPNYNVIYSLDEYGDVPDFEKKSADVALKSEVAVELTFLPEYNNGFITAQIGALIQGGITAELMQWANKDQNFGFSVTFILQPIDADLYGYVKIHNWDIGWPSGKPWNLMKEKTFEPINSTLWTNQ